MANLLPLIDDDGEITPELRGSKNSDSKLDHAISLGKTIMKNRLSNTVGGSTLSYTDNFVDCVDNIVKVSRDKAPTTVTRHSLLLGPSPFECRLAAHFRFVQGNFAFHHDLKKLNGIRRHQV